MSAYPHILGVDIGSVSIAVVALNSRQEIIGSAYEFHHGNTAQKLKEILNRFDLKAVGGIAATAGTPSILQATHRYDGRVAVMKAANFLHDKIGSILVVGGEKFGLIRLDERGNYLGFKSNTGCAAGTGSFLDQQARRLNLKGSAELSRMACSNKGSVPKIASRCAVFAKTDLVHAQQEGCSLAQICDGLCLGLARNIFDTLFTANEFLGPIIFTGGVSRNRAVVSHLQSLTGHEIITDGTLLHGAWGAALNLAGECPAPNLLGLQSADDVLINYFAYMFGGMIRKIGCKIRPTERHQGDTDQVIAAAVEILRDAFLGYRSMAAAVDEVVSNFEAIDTMDPTRLPPRPKVAIFGDLYTRDNSVINQDLIHFIEANGGEVITTPYSELLKMISRPYLRKWLIEGHYLSAISSQALMATLKRKEKIYYTYFDRILKEPKPEYDEPAKDILAHYHVRLENTGESLDNILKIHYIKKHYPDVALFVQASPAFCCPALVTEAMAHEIERKTNTPVVSITYDGTGGIHNDVLIPYLKYPRRERRIGKDNLMYRNFNN